jgi:hypothetical protein
LECGFETQTVGRKAVQVVEDANEGVRRRRLAGVDLGADEIERPLEPGDLEKREVVVGIGVAAIKSSRTICCTLRRLRFSAAAMARIDSPAIRRAKMRCARLCSSVEDRTGLADAGTGMGLCFLRRNDKSSRCSEIEQ